MSDLWVLDTDTVSLFQRGDPEVSRRVLATPAEQLCVTVITVEEQLSGWFTLLRRARKPQELASAYRQLAETVRFYGKIRILPFDEAAIARYESLLAAKLNVGKMDLRIAAIVCEQSGKLVTRNERDFSRIPGLARNCNIFNQFLERHEDAERAQ